MSGMILDLCSSIDLGRTEVQYGTEGVRRPENASTPSAFVRQCISLCASYNPIPIPIPIYNVWIFLTLSNKVHHPVRRMQTKRKTIRFM